MPVDCSTDKESASKTDGLSLMMVRIDRGDGKINQISTQAGKLSQKLETKSQRQSEM